MKKKKVVFLWSGMSGYMVACWKAFAKKSEYESHFLVAWYRMPWSPDIADSLQNFHRLHENNMQEKNGVCRLVDKIDPDIIVICGWLHKEFRKVVFSYADKDTRLVLAMDTPWKGTPRQYIAKYLLKNYLNKFSMVVVAGERTFQYAKYLGFTDGKIKRGVYAGDTKAFSNCLRKRNEGEWPQSFLFIGRLTEGKGIPELLNAYRSYRSKVERPWKLIICGAGKLENEVKAVEGVEYRGFVQPDQLPKYFTESGAFVLPSRYEPWGVVVAEACGAGLPIICTESVNAAIDLVRPYYNGISVGTCNVEQLSDAMLWIGQASPQTLMEFGQHSVELSGPFSAEYWAEKWAEFLNFKS